MKQLFLALFAALVLAITAPATALAADGAATVQTVVNVNAAGLEELQALPGVGPVMAERILAYREANGQFASVDDLAKVKGLGSRTIDKLRPLVVLR